MFEALRKLGSDRIGTALAAENGRLEISGPARVRPGSGDQKIGEWAGRDRSILMCARFARQHSGGEATDLEVENAGGRSRREGRRYVID